MVAVERFGDVMLSLKTKARRQRFASPPRLRKEAERPQPESQDLSAARHREKSGISWGKIAAGVGMVAGTALSMAGPASAAPPVEVELEAPEVVVLSSSIERVDLERKTETDCDTDSSGAPICQEENVAYHPVGVHAGKGVVRDLNGNLFVAPQLVAKDAPGVATVNPDFVEVRGPFGSRGRLERQRDGDYRTDGSLFGHYNIEMSKDSAEIRERGLFGSSWQVEIENHGSRTRINERFGMDYDLKVDGNETELEQVAFFGGASWDIDYKPNSVTVDYPGWLTGETTVSYDSDSLERRDNGWLTSRVVTGSEGGQPAFTVKDGGVFSSSISHTVDTKAGWTDRAAGLFSSSYRYKVDGGQNVPAK